MYRGKKKNRVGKVRGNLGEVGKSQGGEVAGGASFREAEVDGKGLSENLKGTTALRGGEGKEEEKALKASKAKTKKK